MTRTHSSSPQRSTPARYRPVNRLTHTEDASVPLRRSSASSVQINPRAGGSPASAKQKSGSEAENSCHSHTKRVQPTGFSKRLVKSLYTLLPRIVAIQRVPNRTLTVLPRPGYIITTNPEPRGAPGSLRTEVNPGHPMRREEEEKNTGSDREPCCC